MFEDPAPRPPREGRPQSVQLALRVAMLGGLAVVLFAVLFFRLWVLQVLSAERYQTAAAASQARTVRVSLEANGSLCSAVLDARRAAQCHPQLFHIT